MITAAYLWTSGIGVLTTGMPAARYSSSLRGSTARVQSFRTYGMRPTSNACT